VNYIPSNLLSGSPPPPLPKVKIYRPVCGWAGVCSVPPVELTDGKGGGESSQIRRRRESLVLYKAFITLCLCPWSSHLSPVQSTIQHPKVHTSVPLLSPLVLTARKVVWSRAKSLYIAAATSVGGAGRGGRWKGNLNTQKIQLLIHTNLSAHN
jgi:hypothetical protein